MIYLNGKFMAIEEACVPVLDRGFIFGDGVYEVIPVYSRRAFRLAGHLQRLQRSLDAVRIPNPHTDQEWGKLIEEIINGNEGEDQYIYLHVTRGVAKRDHAFPKDIQPTVFMMSSVLTAPPASLRETGIAAVTAIDNRWLRCDIKSISLLPNILLRQQAINAGAVETILLRDGFMTEGAASNIFVIYDDILLAPPKDHLMLPGITYDLVLELAEAHGIPFEIGRIPEDKVRNAQELWLTSSTKEVLPITILDGKSVGSGKPGPLGKRMHALYQEYKVTVMRAA